MMSPETENLLLTLVAIAGIEGIVVMIAMIIRKIIYVNHKRFLSKIKQIR